MMEINQTSFSYLSGLAIAFNKFSRTSGLILALTTTMRFADAENLRTHYDQVRTPDHRDKA